VNRIGWSGDTFVLPDENIGPKGGEMILFEPPREMGHHLRTLGSLEQWRENVGRYCSKNSRLLFCVSCAAAAPLLYFVGEQSGGFHLVADTTVGKTTCLMVAGSFWGGGGQNGFVQSWLTTANALENTAEWHNHVLLCLDELKLIDPEQASKVAYSLANGQSKGRMGRDTHAHRRVEWQLLFLSSGEIGLQSHLEVIPQKRLYGGQTVRFCEIPARVDESGGAFEFMHEFQTPKAFSEHLKAASRTYYGSACRDYLRQLARLGYDQVRSAVQQHQKGFADRFIPATVPPDVARVGVRFSLVAAAGELITGFGISGWQPGEAQRAAGACFEAWRAQRGGGAWDETQALRHVKSVLAAHGNSRFQFFGEGQSNEIRIVNRLGFRTFSRAGESEYLIVPEMFREICGPYPEELVRRTLQKRGFLKGTDARHVTVKRTLPELGRVRCYVISSEIFAGDENENNEKSPAE
jgi:putative DNA primase/helicase